MYILKNAWISIIRNKGRNILIGIIILVISATCAVTLAIKNSSSKLISSYQSKYDVVATIGINRENMMKGFDPENKDDSRENMKEKYSDISNITVDDIEKYGDSNYVKNYYYTMNIGVNSSLTKATNTKKDDMKNMPPGGDKRGGGGFTNETSGDFTLIGYSSIDAMGDFINGNYTVTSGEVFEDFESYSCLINSELATLNNIKVGSEIKIIDAENTKKTYKLKVVGIYEEKEKDTFGSNMSMFTNSANNIITNVNFVKKMTSKNSDLKVSISPSFVLNNKDDIDKFSKELTEKGLSEYLSVNTNLEQVESATSTISNVSNFATTFLIITLIIGAIVLFVINMINIRERKYEIGVLRTIGMKKSLLTFQFMIEIAIVSLVALMIGAVIGSTLSMPVSNSLLKNEIEESRSNIEDIGKNFGHEDMKRPDNKFNGVNVVQAYDSIDAVVDIKVILELLSIGITLTLISSSASMISIQKFSPLTILKERS